MPYNSETSQYERRETTVIDATPDGDTVAQAIGVKLDDAADDAVTDLNHHAANAGHYPATTVTSLAQTLRKSPAGAVSWVNAPDELEREIGTIYLGAYSSAPTTDAYGDALVAGASYYDTTTSKIYVWNGAAWETGVTAGVKSLNGMTGDVTGFVQDSALDDYTTTAKLHAALLYF